MFQYGFSLNICTYFLLWLQDLTWTQWPPSCERLQDYRRSLCSAWFSSKEMQFQQDGVRVAQAHDAATGNRGLAGETRIMCSERIDWPLSHDTACSINCTCFSWQCKPLHLSLMHTHMYQGWRPYQQIQKNGNINGVQIMCCMNTYTTHTRKTVCIRIHTYLHYQRTTCLPVWSKSKAVHTFKWPWSIRIVHIVVACKFTYFNTTCAILLHMYCHAMSTHTGPQWSTMLEKHYQHGLSQHCIRFCIKTTSTMYFQPNLWD